MDNELFERLLYEEENTTIDFKKEQYRFVKATDDDKSKLLKDILGFANAWRRSDAYILIGVEDVRGGRSHVIGIPETDHLDDHALQQFVNNLTNRPVQFLYEAFGFEGKHVGIIRIDEQIRPIYLKKDYGKLERDKVYIRRGSSTDPTKPASPDEIAQMGISSFQSIAELLVEFADVKQDETLGTNISRDAEFCEMPPRNAIPALPRPGHKLVYPYSLNSMNRSNDDFYRELADFIFKRRLFWPIRLIVRNVGQVAANNVRIELTVTRNAGVWVMYESALPEQPKQYASPWDKVMNSIRPPSGRNPGDVSIDKNDERFQVEIDCGNLQPGRRVWSDVFYIAKGVSGDLTLRGLIFADNLPQPQDFTLTVSVTVTKTAMTVDELQALSGLAGRGE